MELDPEGQTLVRDAAEVMLTGHRPTIVWSCVSGARAIAVVAFDDDPRPDIQVALVRTARGAWKAVGAGQAGDWSPLERPLGVATRIVPVPDGVDAVRVREQDGVEREEPVLGGSVFLAAWDVEYHGEWAFPELVALHAAEGWQPAPVA